MQGHGFKGLKERSIAPRAQSPRGPEFTAPGSLRKPRSGVGDGAARSRAFEGSGSLGDAQLHLEPRVPADVHHRALCEDQILAADADQSRGVFGNPAQIQ